MRLHGPALAIALALGCASAQAAAPANVAHGEEVYNRCVACHALKADRVGPHHCGVIGRRAGSVPDFAYSGAMKNSKLVWNEKTLDRFLVNPMKVVPGTSMTYAGVPDSTDRRDLIAYLKHANEGPQCRK